MKRSVFMLITTGVLCLSFVAGTFAGPPTANGENAKVIAQLERRAQRLEQHAQTTKGAGRQEFELQRTRVNQLIKKLKAGEPVDPQEIDALLR